MKGQFSSQAISEYLEQVHERFWLFHPEKPFYQVNEAKKGTEYTAAKLNGEISESSNKIRMFATRAGEKKQQLTYAEAARWLLFINGYDDTSAKPRKKGLPSPGAGWIGRLGIVEAVGHNLFETLMLNLVFDRMGDKWNENCPVREQEPKAVVAVDIPSGVSSETGAALGEAAEADLTVTFGYEKLGMVFYPGRKLCGEIVIADIGFPAYTKYEGHTYFAYDPEDRNQIPKRRADANKGTYGKILIAAGSEGMCGAAYLSALAAYRMGAGLVKILTVRANVPILQNLLPEAILTPYDPEQAQTDPAGFKSLVEQECGWASAIVLGPGLGKEAHVASLVQNVLLSAYVPIIVDADGLNAVAQHPHLSGYFTENVIVTPHLGEMARLTGRSIEDLKRDLVESAVRYGEEKGVTCVLKDAVTVTAGRDGNVYIGDSGCAAMAKGGSGDVLTGVIAGLLALGFSEDEAAALGVFLHGRAGAAAACKKGEHSVLARDIADCLLEKID